jgi:hypothetical protein
MPTTSNSDITRHGTTPPDRNCLLSPMNFAPSCSPLVVRISGPYARQPNSPTPHLTQPQTHLPSLRANLPTYPPQSQSKKLCALRASARTFFRTPPRIPMRLSTNPYSFPCAARILLPSPRKNGGTSARRDQPMLYLSLRANRPPQILRTCTSTRTAPPSSHPAFPPRPAPYSSPVRNCSGPGYSVPARRDSRG